MKKFVQGLQAIGVVALIVLIVDFIHVMILLLFSSSFTLHGVQSSGEGFAYWLNWGTIFIIAGIVFMISAPITYFQFRKLSKRVEELEAEKD